MDLNFLFQSQIHKSPVVPIHGAPTESTKGEIYGIYIDVDSPNHNAYKCVKIDNGVYTWMLLEDANATVLYAPQALTSEQKAQVRENIGAVSADEIGELGGGVTEERVNELIIEALAEIPNAEEWTIYG